MSCSPFDLRDYFFDELNREERVAVENHAAACHACREELSSLGFTRNLLLSLPEEEPGRRIAFVSDKVFEPRWWQKIWHSAPQLGFVSSCILACAIVAHGYLTPAAVPENVVEARAVQTASSEQQSLAQVRSEYQKIADGMRENLQQRNDEAIKKAVDDRVKQLTQEHRTEVVALQDYWSDRLQKEQGLYRRAAFDTPPTSGVPQ